ncbi:MAG: hypothetical protein ACYTF6_08260 [Planctomycetota bacterium]|jgi:hypothetical protein
MTGKLVSIVGLAVLLSTFASVSAAKLKITEPEGRNRNILSLRLEGKWVLDEDLSRRFDGDPNAGREGGAFSAIGFKSDPEVLDKLPEKKYLEELPIYMAGWMRRELDDKKMDNPFIVTVYMGNPVLVYFRDVPDEPFGDTESFHVMLTPSDRKENDLLFIGGDHVSEPFRAFSRVKPETSAQPAEQGKMPPELAKAIREVIRLIEARDFEGLVKRFMQPDDLKELIENNGLEAAVEQISKDEDGWKRRVAALKLALETTPKMSEDGERAVFDDLGDDEESYESITFILIDGKWYVK